MNASASKEIWLVVGSQHLYGPETLEQVAANASHLAKELNHQLDVPVDFVFKQVVATSEQIYEVCLQATQELSCLGVVTWMHTFSPAKMWIRGLKVLHKPLCHLHTQFNSQIPWNDIDMDFMNLNQSAHGDREFGHLLTRLKIKRKVIVGFWQSPRVMAQLTAWIRATMGWGSLQHLKVARFGDNMRDVAVTEGDKVAAHIGLGVVVDGFGMGDLVEQLDAVPQDQIELLIRQYADQYVIREDDIKNNSLKEAARIEIGLRKFLEQGGFGAFSDTFENLHGLHQLPGIAVQRLMHEGYGFGAEGDWKTAALLRSFKVMNEEMKGGSSFMEDYTYHFNEADSMVLGAHMLEVCPSIASEKPRCEIHPLSIGGKNAPARLIFEADSGPAINISLVDIGNRLRFVANTVQVEKPPQELPNLPVARVLWKPDPSLEVSAHAWMLAGGAHHTVFSQAITLEIIEDLAEIAGIELLIIDKNTNIRDFKDKLHWNESYYR